VTDTLSQTQDALKAKTQAEADLQGRYDALKKQYDNLRATAKNAVAVADQNRTLKRRTATLSKRLSAVSSENETLKNTGLLRWFMAGGGVLLVGLILGLLMPHLVRRRRDNWFS
jgi:SH3 domain protein